MKRILFSFILAAIFPFHFILADSPLTSTPFWEAYKTEQIIAEAMQASGTLTTGLADFLVSKKHKIDVKMAVINCLSWDFNGKSNSDFFLKYLIDKRIYESKSDFQLKGRADHLLCLAYLKAMDDYFSVIDAASWADLALEGNTKSYTFAIIHALIHAQLQFDNNWCLVYLMAHNVRTNKKLKKDMNDEAIEIIFNYMDLYKEYCDQ